MFEQSYAFDYDDAPHDVHDERALRAQKQPLARCIEFARRRNKASASPLRVWGRQFARGPSFLSYSYVAASSSFFYDQVLSVAQRSERSFNEILVVDSPCKTYVDIDLKSTDDNHLSDDDLSILGIWIVNAIIAETAALFQLNGHEILLPACVLYACKPGKFSAHLILDTTDGYAWRNTRACGMFVNLVVETIASRDGLTPEQVNALRESVDDSVYSSNRLMRVYGGIKCGEPNRPLLPLHVTSLDDPLSKELFEESLISDYFFYKGTRAAHHRPLFLMQWPTPPVPKPVWTTPKRTGGGGGPAATPCRVTPESALKWARFVWARAAHPDVRTLAPSVELREVVVTNNGILAKLVERQCPFSTHCHNNNTGYVKFVSTRGALCCYSSKCGLTTGKPMLWVDLVEDEDDDENGTDDVIDLEPLLKIFSKK